MGGDRDQADRPLWLVVGPVKRADRQQPGIFTGRTGVGLQRDRGKPGDLGQPRLELGE